MGKKKQLRCCKICGTSVKNGKGLQCCGTCACWYHFKCLCYDKKKIRAIVKGVERIECPCPDCTMIPPGVMKSPCGGNDTKCGSIIRQFSADCPDMFNPARTGENPCQMLMDSYGQLRQPSALAPPMQCEQLPICPPETCQEFKDLANVMPQMNAMENYVPVQQYQPQQFQPQQMYAPPQPVYYPPSAPMNMHPSQHLTSPCPPNPCPPIPCPDPCLPGSCPPCPASCPFSHCSTCAKDCCKECKKKKKECEKKKKQLLKKCKPPKLRDKSGACVNCKQVIQESPSLASCCQKLTVCSSMEKLTRFQNKTATKPLCGADNLQNINNLPAIIDQSDQAKGLIKLICKEVVSRGTDPENKFAICPHNYNYSNTGKSNFTTLTSDDTDFVHTQPSSFSEGNLENDIEVSNQRALSLNTVEKMCKTVGKLTCQINDLMDKLKQTITYPEPTVKDNSHDSYGCASSHNKNCRKVGNRKERRAMNHCF